MSMIEVLVSVMVLVGLGIAAHAIHFALRGGQNSLNGCRQ